ncbi:flagellar assembly protein FliH [Treponema vincentii ATCC 35580]|uniref:Flagellar assembly protein FliH n=1 Tax=Treponema vincentii ATCC 35580 TaxID=596324 RepID=C8PS11_9SPIR|nr:flagellar assembly protein FliH [Treponema vincentii ATCC 35580]
MRISKTKRKNLNGNGNLKKSSSLPTLTAKPTKLSKTQKKTAFEEAKRQMDVSQIDAQKAREQAQEVVSDAEKKAADIIDKAEQTEAATQKKAFTEGFDAGREAGFKEGKVEVTRLIERLHTMIERTMDKREEILAETEQQIVDLVLLMTRKIVKVISENQRNVVTSNIIHALRKVKGRADVIIRVNLADVGLTSEHTKDFLAAAENIKNITVVEDLSVDAGGCIIETDFGSVDARISSQLHELEQRILEISPIRTRAASSDGSPNRK